MSLEIVTVPCRADNYAYVVRDSDRDVVAVIDAPDAAPIKAALDARGWTPGALLLTHHHDDHVEGVEALRARYGLEVVGAAADRHRLPPLDRAVGEGEAIDIGDYEAVVFDAPGHTRGHVAYHIPRARALFSADSLMVMGCGRLFEGTAQEMWATLSKLAALPPDTRVFSGHEYTEANLRFAEALDPDHPQLAARATAIRDARAAGRDTMGPTLAEERATNPFLRAAEPALKARLGLDDATDAEAFAEIRRRKDAF